MITVENGPGTFDALAVPADLVELFILNQIEAFIDFATERGYDIDLHVSSKAR